MLEDNLIIKCQHIPRSVTTGVREERGKDGHDCLRQRDWNGFHSRRGFQAKETFIHTSRAWNIKDSGRFPFLPNSLVEWDAQHNTRSMNAGGFIWLTAKPQKYLSAAARPLAGGWCTRCKLWVRASSLGQGPRWDWREGAAPEKLGRCQGKDSPATRQSGVKSEREPFSSQTALWLCTPRAAAVPPPRAGSLVSIAVAFQTQLSLVTDAVRRKHWSLLGRLCS